jgi:hypothetical protein
LDNEIQLKDMRVYDALPCHLDGYYYINGVMLSEYDFGIGEDDGDYDGDVDEDVAHWGCIHRVFKRHTDDEHINKAIKEYDITREEYDLIADRLEEVLYVGMCGWCV